MPLERFAEKAPEERPPLFDARGISVAVAGKGEETHILRSVSLELDAETFTVILGASGSGKTILVKTLTGLLEGAPQVVAGSLRISREGRPGVDVLEGLEAAVASSGGRCRRVAPWWRRAWRQRMQEFWGSTFGYVPQYGNLALDPTQRLGVTLAEAIRSRARARGEKANGDERRDEVLEWLQRLEFRRPREASKQYPSQLSGGMAQRAAIAFALARGARVLVADEPTTGLDTDKKQRLVELLLQLRGEGWLRGLVLVTHDIRMARGLAERLVVLHDGQIIQNALAGVLLDRQAALHPRTLALLQGQEGAGRTRAGFPLCHKASQASMVGRAVLLEATGLRKRYPVGERRLWGSREWRWMLNGVDLELAQGEVVGLMGPSGVGKTTLARCLVGQLEPDEGRVLVCGRGLRSGRGRDAPGASANGTFRRNAPSSHRIQLLFQSVEAMLHPQMTVEEGLRETLCRVVGRPRVEAEGEIEGVLGRVGRLRRRHAFPCELSGGELRRVGVARVLLVRPAVLVTDEPTAGVDAHLEGEILDLLAGLARSKEAGERSSILIISHDESALRRVVDRLLVLEDGVLADVTSKGGSTMQRTHEVPSNGAGEGARG